MTKRYYLLAVFLITLKTMCFAQNNSTKKADTYYDRFEFAKATEAYKKNLENGNDDAYIYLRLANSYFNLYNTKEAEYYYELYFNTLQDKTPAVYHRYSLILKSNKKYDRSNEIMSDFYTHFPNDKRAMAFKKDQNYVTDLLNSEEKFTLAPMTINTAMDDFGGYEKNNTFYFVSSRNESRQNYAWNQQPTLDVYISNMNGNAYGASELLKGDVNTKFNEGTICISPDGNTMYFSRNDYLDKQYSKASNGVNQLKMYRATLNEGEWTRIEPLSFSNSEYSTSHPALSPDGKTLYFSSDMPGGYGESDLYKVSINNDGSFGTPENLGETINTEGRESFPFIDVEGTLYFSSDGQLGLGGLDVFYAKTEGNGYATVKNIGIPINSSGDDFAYSFDATTKKGYLTSNRDGAEKNAPNDNIYRIEQLKPLETISLTVSVIDVETGSPILNANVENNDEKNSQFTDATGVVTFENLLKDKAYNIIVAAENYENYTGKLKEGENLVVELKPIKSMIVENEILLNPIEFDYDKATISPEAAVELNKVITVMKKNPEMIVHVEAHTDARGSAAYNQKLSENRAKNTVDYIMSQGIDKTRISWEAFGESKPKVNCDPCSALQFQENRRTVFKIEKWN